MPGQKATLRLDDLQYKGLAIYQRRDLPCFTQDSVFLANFADMSPSDYAVDLGAGTGALSILCHARTGAGFTCVEQEPELCNLLKKSILHNGLGFPVHQMDWAEAPKALGHGIFSAAICNPPYFPVGTQSPYAIRAFARGGRQAGDAPLRSACEVAAKLLKNGGKFYICYPATQLPAALCLLQKSGMEPKRMRLVAHSLEKPPYLALLLAHKGGNPGMTQLPMLFIKDENGEYTNEYKEIYHLEEAGK